MTNDDADRLLNLLDVALAQVRNGDDESALLALQEGLATAQRMPKKDAVIYLPDLSRSSAADASPGGADGATGAGAEVFEELPGFLDRREKSNA